MFSASFLFASLLWGSVGFGYFIYGRKQGAWSPTFAGVAMMALSYFVASALVMSLLCIGIILGVYYFHKQGF
jgi:hypothetical protein